MSSRKYSYTNGPGTSTGSTRSIEVLAYGSIGNHNTPRLSSGTTRSTGTRATSTGTRAKSSATRANRSKSVAVKRNVLEIKTKKVTQKRTRAKSSANRRRSSRETEQSGSGSAETLPTRNTHTCNVTKLCLASTVNPSKSSTGRTASTRSTIRTKEDFERFQSAKRARSKSSRTPSTAGCRTFSPRATTQDFDTWGGARGHGTTTWTPASRDTKPRTRSNRVETSPGETSQWSPVTAKSRSKSKSKETVVVVKSKSKRRRRSRKTSKSCCCGCPCWLWVLLAILLLIAIVFVIYFGFFRGNEEETKIQVQKKIPAKETVSAWKPSRPTVSGHKPKPIPATQTESSSWFGWLNGTYARYALYGLIALVALLLTCACLPSGNATVVRHVQCHVESTGCTPMLPWLLGFLAVFAFISRDDNGTKLTNEMPQIAPAVQKQVVKPAPVAPPVKTPHKTWETPVWPTVPAKKPEPVMPTPPPVVERERPLPPVIRPVKRRRQRPTPPAPKPVVERPLPPVIKPVTPTPLPRLEKKTTARLLTAQSKPVYLKEDAPAKIEKSALESDLSIAWVAEEKPAPQLIAKTKVETLELAPMKSKETLTLKLIDSKESVKQEKIEAVVETRKEASAEVSTSASTITSSTESMAALSERYREEREEISSMHVSSSITSASTAERTEEKPETPKRPLLAFHPEQGHTHETTGEISTKMKPGQTWTNYEGKEWKDYGDSLEARLAPVKDRFPNF